MRIYYYKMTTDNLGAPHVMGGLLSLAICKPSIRRIAPVGSLIFGFAGNGLHSDNRLIYLAEVTETLEGAEYYKELTERGDAIYEFKDNKFELRQGALYHADGNGMVRDVGTYPHYANARVLLSRKFVYFGVNGPADYQNTCPRLVCELKTLGPGHRVNHCSELQAELGQLFNKLINSEVAVIEPTETNQGRPCYKCTDDDDGLDEVVCS